MAIDIKALRNKLKETAAPQNGRTFQTDGAAYPFWNIENGTTATVRFLDDADKDNQYFWRERLMINLEFDGIVGQKTDRSVIVQVPCMEMYGDTCPILTEARKFYKDGRDELGQKYWKKKSYLFQGFIRQNPLNEENLPENPIRRLTINPNIYKNVFAYLLDEDTEESPTDYENGSDFRIKKTQNGQYADYSTSDFARKSSALTDEELAAIDQYGLFNLSEYLPKKPDDETLRAIIDMFEASLAGDEYDPSRFANFYRPRGLEWDGNASGGSSAGTASKESVSHAREMKEEKASEDKPPFDMDENEDVPAKPVAEEGGKTKVSPQELLMRLKKQQN